MWNASAGSKVSLLTETITEERLRAVMRDNELGSDLRATTSEEEAREAARDARRDGIDVLVAVGGDGTVGTLAEELAGSPVALGILPGGTVMNIARSLGLPRTIEEAA
ncbi:MAG: acylglycerol kinase family protein, partial [Chloroflexi bacterium]|nr:acylglycerol kinase family protein [Chloroflexota bacterium]